MLRKIIPIALILISPASLFGAENLLKNGGFEQRNHADNRFPAEWTQTHHDSSPLQFTGEHHDGMTGALLVGDGKSHLWRQNIVAATARQFTLSAWVKADDVQFRQPDDHAFLYAHILYKNHPTPRRPICHASSNRELTVGRK